MRVWRQIEEPVRKKVGALWVEGLTQREISARTGVSRNSVRGIVKRLGLPAREQDLKRRPNGWTARKIALSKPLSPVAIGPIGTFPDKMDCCRYPMNGNGQPFQVCGHPGFPYCEFHTAKCHAPRAQQKIEADT